MTMEMEGSFPLNDWLNNLNQFVPQLASGIDRFMLYGSEGFHSSDFVGAMPHNFSMASMFESAGLDVETNEDMTRPCGKTPREINLIMQKLSTSMLTEQENIFSQKFSQTNIHNKDDETTDKNETKNDKSIEDLFRNQNRRDENVNFCSGLNPSVVQRNFCHFWAWGENLEDLEDGQSDKKDDKEDQSTSSNNNVDKNNNKCGENSNEKDDKTINNQKYDSSPNGKALDDDEDDNGGPDTSLPDYRDLDTLSDDDDSHLMTTDHLFKKNFDYQKMPVDLSTTSKLCYETGRNRKSSKKCPSLTQKESSSTDLAKNKKGLNDEQCSNDNCNKPNPFNRVMSGSSSNGIKFEGDAAGFTNQSSSTRSSSNNSGHGPSGSKAVRKRKRSDKSSSGLSGRPSRRKSGPAKKKSKKSNRKWSNKSVKRNSAKKNKKAPSK